MTAEATVMMTTSFALALSADSGTTYTAVKEVKSFDLGNITSDQVDVTSFTSSGNFREFKSGFKEADEGSFVINYLIEDTQHKALRDAVGGVAQYFKATATAVDGDDEICTFQALITSMSRPVQIGEVWEATVSIKLTGVPVYTTTP